MPGSTRAVLKSSTSCPADVRAPWWRSWRPCSSAGSGPRRFQFMNTGSMWDSTSISHAQALNSTAYSVECWTWRIMRDSFFFQLYNRLHYGVGWSRGLGEFVKKLGWDNVALLV